MSVTRLVLNCLMNIDLYPVFGNKYIVRHHSYIGITMELKKTGRHRRHGFVQSNHSSRPHILFFRMRRIIIRFGIFTYLHYNKHLHYTDQICASGMIKSDQHE